MDLAGDIIAIERAKSVSADAVPEAVTTGSAEAASRRTGRPVSVLQWMLQAVLRHRDGGWPLAGSGA